MEPKSRRREHSAELKATVLAACQLPGASVAAVALSHGLNANLVRKWLGGRGLKRSGLQAPGRPAKKPAALGAAALEPQAVPRFVSVPIPQATPAPAANSPVSACGDIRLEFRHGALQVCVAWPLGAASECAAWLREVLR